jgi:acyl transferase domain-containing protein
MPDRLAFLFPGQGSFASGVLADIGSAFGSVARTLLAVDAVAMEFGHAPLSQVLLQPPADSAHHKLGDDPDVEQIGQFATSVALAALLEAEYGIEPDVVFGHSFGEVAALTVAGVLTVADGARVVCERIAAVRGAGAGAGGMVAVEMNAVRARHLIGVLDDWQLSVAAENSPRQTVVSGPEDSLDRVCSLAQQLRVRATRLRSGYPFHNPMMCGAAGRFGRSLRNIAFSPPRRRVYADLLGRQLTSGDDVRAILAAHLTEPVRMLAAVRRMFDDGAGRFLECGAGTVLTDLALQCVPAVTTIAPLSQRVDPDELSRILERAPERAVAPPSAASTASNGELLAELRTLYAAELEYPENILTADAALEADLGVDSLRQTTLLGEVLQNYGLAQFADSVRPTEYPTLAAIAELVSSLKSGSADPVGNSRRA